MARRFASVLLTLAAANGCGRIGYDLHDTPSSGDGGERGGAGGGGLEDGSARAGGGPSNGGAGAGGTTDAGPANGSGGQGGLGGAIGGNCTPAVKTICKPAISLVNRDTDGDGTFDVWDDDDDDDGIPDVTECFSGVIAPLMNRSFEDPVIPGAPGSMSFLGSEVEGWEDTASDQLIDFWQKDQLGVPAVSGDQFIQLNRTEPQAIYQDVLTVPNLTLRWGFYHRGRAGSETVELFLGTLASPSSQGKFTTGKAAWVQYAGQYVVPAGQTTTRLRIASIVPSTSAGNFLDQIALSPACTRDSDRDGCVDSEDLDSNGDCTLD